MRSEHKKMTERTKSWFSGENTTDGTQPERRMKSTAAILAWGHAGTVRAEFLNSLGGQNLSAELACAISRHDIASGDHAVSLTLFNTEREYTRDHLTAASNAARALLVIDAARGFDDVIAMHSLLLHRAGIADIWGIIGSGAGAFSQVRFDEISRDLSRHAQLMGGNEIRCVPLAPFKDHARRDVDETQPAVFSPELLADGLKSEAVELKSEDFRMTVTALPGEGNTVIAGTIVSGGIHPGERIVALPSSQTAQVERVEADQGESAEVWPGDQLHLHLDKALNVEPGQLLTAAEGRPEVADQIRAQLFWSSATPMLPGRTYIIELCGQSATASITDIRFRESYNNLQKIAAKRLHRGDFGEVNLSFDKELAFDAFNRLSQSGHFRKLDKTSGEEIATGLVRFGLRRATNIHRQAIDIDALARSDVKGQQPCCIWFTGLSGSGKSTIANALETRLHEMGRHTYILDGDNVRHGLNRDLGFTDADRVENIRRIGEVAKLMVDAGLIVMTAFISPFRSERRMARELFGQGQFIEVFVDTPLDVCETRDPKGLYKKARAGEIANFTGIDSAYEAPERAELSINAGLVDADELVDQIIAELDKRNMLSAG